MTEKGKHAGRSIIERLWEQMDIKYAAAVEFDNTLQPDFSELKGQVIGLRYAICVMQYPYDAVKEGMEKVKQEAHERYLANVDPDGNESDEYDPEDA